MAKLKRKTVKNYRGNVYDLTVEKTHSYNINGLSVHNSAGGCLLSWTLGIVDLDPIQHGLYFERFMNPYRKCLTENNYVLLKSGKKKKISNVVVGDDVMSETGIGKLIEVVSRDIEPEEDVFLIETEDGASIELTGDHLIPVIRGGNRIDIKVKELTVEDFVLSF